MKQNVPAGRDPDEYAHRVCYTSVGKSAEHEHLPGQDADCPCITKADLSVDCPFCLDLLIGDVQTKQLSAATPGAVNPTYGGRVRCPFCGEMTEEPALHHRLRHFGRTYPFAKGSGDASILTLSDGDAMLLLDLLATARDGDQFPGPDEPCKAAMARKGAEDPEALCAYFGRRAGKTASFLPEELIFNVELLVKAEQNGQRLIGGWASVEVLDKHGEVIAIEAFTPEMLAWFLKETPNIHLQHSSIPVGKFTVLEKRWNDDANAWGAWAEGLIYDRYTIHNATWEAIQKGRIKGLSIKGRALHKEQACTDSLCFHFIPMIELYEGSLVVDPANPESLLVMPKPQVAMADAMIKGTLMSGFFEKQAPSGKPPEKPPATPPAAPPAQPAGAAGQNPPAEPQQAPEDLGKAIAAEIAKQREADRRQIYQEVLSALKGPEKAAQVAAASSTGLAAEVKKELEDMRAALPLQKELLELKTQQVEMKAQLDAIGQPPSDPATAKDRVTKQVQKASTPGGASRATPSASRGPAQAAAVGLLQKVVDVLDQVKAGELQGKGITKALGIDKGE